MKLYDYQEECISNIYKSLEKHKNVFVQSPTGSGKTVIFNYIACEFANQGKRVLIIADRKELIQQTQLRLYKDHGIRSGIILSGYDTIPFLKIQVASIQTLNRRTLPADIDLIIIDEARGSISSSYMKIIEHYQMSKILGFDATPIRTSGHGFDHVYQDLILGPTIKNLEKNGKLVPAKCFINPIDKFALSQVKIKSTGDYDETELEHFMEKNKVNADLVESYLKHANGEKVIIFAINIPHSKKIEKYYNEAGIVCRHIDGTMDSYTRDNIIKQFRNGSITALVNVGIATYGFDEKTIRCVQLARPTKSLALYLQMIGRGSRTAEGKDYYILLDNANCIIDHGRPNDERKWSLKGKKHVKKDNNKKRLFKVKLPNGEIKIFEESKIPLGIKGIDMIELKSNFRTDVFTKLLKQAEYKNYKKSYAMFKFFEQNEEVSDEELRYISSTLNFQYSFVCQMYNDILLKKSRETN